MINEPVETTKLLLKDHVVDVETELEYSLSSQIDTITTNEDTCLLHPSIPQLQY
jgi:hypothetical protein